MIEVDYRNRQAKIVMYDYATAKEIAVLVDSSSSAKIPFFHRLFLFKRRAENTLETEVERIYRRSKRATYYVYDRQTKTPTSCLVEKCKKRVFLPTEKR